MTNLFLLFVSFSFMVTGGSGYKIMKVNKIAKVVFKYVSLGIPVLVTLAIPVTILVIIIHNRLYKGFQGVKLIIDHDGGADDALAIFMALLSEKCFDGSKLIALSTTRGNVDEGQSFINTQRILDVAQRQDIPIYRGSNSSIIRDLPSDHFFGEDGLGDNENVQYQPLPAEDLHSAIALIEYSKRHKDELVIVALGAATNIALAVRLDPKFLGRLKHLYIAAGTVYSEANHEPEYNADQDVEAYYMAVRDATPDRVTILPFSQVYSSMNVSKSWREDVLGAIDTNIMRAQNEFERISLSKTTNGVWSLLDPVAMATFIDPNVILETKFANNSIILCGNDRGINTNTFVGEHEANVKMVYSLSDHIYKKLLIKLFNEC